MDLLKPLIALLAIVNPIGVVPFFIHFTQNLTREQRRRTIRVSSFTAFIVIALSAIAGLKIIEFFGISLASFQVGGGTLLLISSIQMLNAQPAEGRKEDVSEGTSKVDAGASIAVVPLTIPLLTGPATISTVVIYSERTRHWWELAVLPHLCTLHGGEHGRGHQRNARARRDTRDDRVIRAELEHARARRVRSAEPALQHAAVRTAAGKRDERIARDIGGAADRPMR